MLNDGLNSNLPLCKCKFSYCLWNSNRVKGERLGPPGSTLSTPLHIEEVEERDFFKVVFCIVQAMSPVIDCVVA